MYQLHAALPLWRSVVDSTDELLDQYGEKLADLVSDAAPTDRRYAIEQASEMMAAVDWRHTA